LLALEKRGGECAVTYGPWTAEIARRWEITLSETKVAVTA
jgi:hypothetical protein